MITSLKQLFNESAADLRKLNKLVNQVNLLEKKYESFSDEELKNMTLVFKDKLQNGMKLDDLKIDAFAVVREASKRVLGLRHYDVQLIGGLVLAEGSIAQMNTGEGKTLVATLSSYLYALEEKGVHIVTANEYLARRDKELMGQVHEFLGLKVGLNISQMEPQEKKLAYQADISYGTGTEFGFDYLRDNMVHEKEEKVQRSLHYAIVDEIDSILIDEARTPLIIANKSDDGAELYKIIASIMAEFKDDSEYKIHLETKEVYLTDLGADKIEDAFGIDNLYDVEHQELLHAVTQALKAHAVMKLDDDYIIKDCKIILVDKFTGRIMDGRSFSDGLHQAIEAKEGVEITDENKTFATITVQNYFVMYKKLSGMTGSAMPSRQEFFDTYNLKVVEIPTNKPVQREDFPDLVYVNNDSKIKKIIAEVKKIHQLGRPILIGTASIEKSEELSGYLKKEKIKHQILNAKTEEDEAKLISQAGQKGHIMIATNMAGRGTDIMLSEEVKELGGLHIIGTERHDSNRIDMQLRGRAGRQGDPGSSQFIISLEDDLFAHYDEEEMKRYLKKVKTDETGLVLFPDPKSFTKKVQETVENMHHSSRSHLLKIESVMDRQSKIIYSMRDRMMDMNTDEIIEEALTNVHNYLQQVQENYFSNNGNLKAFLEDLSLVFPNLDWDLNELEELDQEDIEKRVLLEYGQFVSTTSPLKEDEWKGQQLKDLMLHQMDTNWVKYLDYMAQVKDGIGLRGYGQEDPYRYFEIEGYEEFKYLLFMIQKEISSQFTDIVRETTDEFVDELNPDLDEDLVEMEVE
ncbi:accessory Sec system translocase SecA2 [Neobacillus niacini]|uniref:accessory Sec system translocase SecA2 n=1 Tax=Neobacillus niacini TaxID=86668 RepID=UPI00285D6E5C|nr:accessory Sec system translocase SecA2 [Neobacillus niacini]MDR7000074.1 preprotein translocase subunit SecA [Neobacillus niacini]